jgi:hypothetical protein
LLQYTKQILFFQHHIIHPAQKPSSISAERLCYSVYISTDCTPGISSTGNPLYRNAAAWQCTARFYRIAFLPLESDLAHGDFPLLQPVVQTHKVAFAVCQTDRRLGHLHFFSPLDTDQQTADNRNNQPHQTDHLNIFRRTQAPPE